MKFARLEPRFPDAASAKSFTGPVPIELTPDMTREEVIRYLEGRRAESDEADLAFYAARDLSRTGWAPFLKAALERNPVCIEATTDVADEEVISTLASFACESIYDEARLAQPDEVWNCRRGDGVEKAITLATIWRHRYPDAEVGVDILPGRACIRLGDRELEWVSTKSLAAGKILPA